MREHELESVLTRHLGRAAAPPELTLPLRTEARHVTASWTPIWATVAAVLVVATAWGLRSGSRLEFRSADPVRISEWVKAQTGLDVPLRADPPASIRLVGAHAAASAAEVDYQIDGRDASLTVSPAPAGTGAKGSRHAPGVSSWVAGGQVYTLACALPEDSRLACLLCHSEVN